MTFVRRWRAYLRWSEYHRRSVAFRRNRRAGRRPPICYFWTGGCYCDLMPPDQMCTVCMSEGKRLPVAPCVLGLMPHRWRRYYTGNVYASNRKKKREGGHLRRACSRCHRNEARSDGRWVR